MNGRPRCKSLPWLLRFLCGASVKPFDRRGESYVSCLTCNVCGNVSKNKWKAVRAWNLGHTWQR
jgi:hypothetical protein